MGKEQTTDEQVKRHLVRILCSVELIEEALMIPDGYRITGAYWNFDHPRTMRLILEGPEFPEIKDGELIPEIVPTINKSYNEAEGRFDISWEWIVPEKDTKLKVNGDEN